MYGYRGNTSVNDVATVTLPDGREVWMHQTGYIEGDTNGFVEGDFEIRWEGSGGEDLTDEELEQTIDDNGVPIKLSDYLKREAVWRHDDWA